MTSSASEFKIETLAKHIFYQDQYKSFKISYNRLHYSTPFGNKTSDSIEIERSKYCEAEDRYKPVGKVVFPLKVWEGFSVHLGQITHILYTLAGIKIEPTIQHLSLEDLIPSTPIWGNPVSFEVEDRTSPSTCVNNSPPSAVKIEEPVIPSEFKLQVHPVQGL